MKYNSPNVSPVLSAGNKMFLLLIALLSLYGNGNAQNPAINVFEDWNTTSGTQNNFQRSIVRSKGIGGTTYYYLCGSTINSSGNYDFLIQKKNASGVVLWSQTYNGSGNGNDYAADVQIDAVGNVYICGTYYKNSTDSNNAVLIKYNNAGTHQWTQVFNGAGSGHDALAAIQLTSDGILVAGTTWQNSTDMFDMLVMRYDTTGSLIWSQNWDYNDLNDIAVNLYSSRSRIYVAGGVQSAATTYKYGMFTVLYSDGSYQGSVTAGGTAFGFDQLTAIQYDDSGYVYLTGGVLNLSTGYDIKTIKLDTLLNTMWSVTYTSSGVYNDVGTGLALDTAGNIFVTGYKTSATSGKDYVTIKYSSGGTQRWVSTFDGGTNAQDSATAIVVRDTTQIYVTGYSCDSASVKNYYTIKYNGAGTLQWQIAFNSWGNGSDVATAIALDSIGGVIVSGQSDVYGSRAYTTVRYVEAGVITPPDSVSASSAFAFEENRGQLRNTSGSTVTSIRYYNKIMNPAVYFSDSVTSYVWSRIDSVSATNDSILRVDMKLKGGNDSRPYVLNKQDNYFSYLQGYFSNPIPNVPLYSQVLYPEVYSKIDLMYTSNGTGLKHYFIIKVGGNGSNIEMKFNGADSVKVVNDTLMVYTKLGSLKQRRAVAFEIDNSGNRVALAWQPNYSITGSGTVKFINIGSYTSGRTLVLECDWGPNPSAPSAIASLEWSTFLGGSGSTYDDSWDIAANPVNRSWVSGTTTASPFSGNVGFVSTPLTFQGGKDAFVASFSPTAHNLRIVYIGGSSNDEGRGLDEDGQGNIYQVGVTNSTNFTNISNSGINYTNQGGVNEGFFVAINSLGTSTLCDSYIGSAGGDQARGIAVHKGATAGSLDIYIVGLVGSTTTGFPLQPGGAYDQSTYGGGSSDAYIMRLDQNYSNIWTTLFGGSGKDWFNDVALRNPNNEPVVVGITASSTPSANTCAVPTTVGQFPICNNSGAYYNQSYGGGATDACIVEFSSSNALVWSTYFGGSGDETTTGNDIQEPNVTVTNNNDVYLCGASLHPGSNFPFWPSSFGGSYYQTATTGQWAFIARFNSSRQRTWTTLYGAVGQSIITSLDATSDLYGNVYFTGSCSIPGLVGSGNYCQVPPANNQFPMCNYSGANFTETYLPSNPNNGNERTYIAAFNGADQYIWGTLFGTNVINAGTGLSTSADRLYLSAIARQAYNAVDNDALDPNDYLLSTSPVQASNYVVGVSRFDITQIVGIHENSPQNTSGMGLFPNPAFNTVNLYFDSPFDLGTVVQILDFSGRLVAEYQGNVGERSMSIDISGLSNGMYFVQVVSPVTVQSEKLIINR